jgi:branched-chain amino acid transport system permease protein
MHYFGEQLLIGLSLGATYAMIALGYTMVYGVLRLINFAHGDVYMVGGAVGYFIADQLASRGVGVGPTLAAVFVGAVVFCCALGFAIEYFAYRPLRNRPRLVSLITAIGVSLLLENVFQLRVDLHGIHLAAGAMYFGLGPDRHTFSEPIASALMRGGRIEFLRFGLLIILMVALSWVVLRTRNGLALRAVSFRFDTATLMGINTNRIISLTFMLGSGLAAVAGVLDAIQYGVKWDMGVLLGLKAFIAAVLGGIGSIPGAVLGGFCIGLLETFLRGIILPEAYTGYSDAAVFMLLIVILLVRPAGLLGSTATEKV